MRIHYQGVIEIYRIICLTTLYALLLMIENGKCSNSCETTHNLTCYHDAIVLTTMSTSVMILRMMYKHDMTTKGGSIKILMQVPDNTLMIEK